MASASVKEIYPKNPPLEITLKLNVEEVATIAAVLGSVRGSGSLFDQCVKIYWAISDACPSAIRLADRIQDGISETHTNLNIGHICTKE